MKPKQYIQGWTEFYKLKFKVTPNVLIPRPETELLVDEILEFIKLKNIKSSLYTKYYIPYTILDIGTGSGCIAISIAKNTPQAKIIAADISKEALDVAKQNAKFHGALDKITFIQSNLLVKFTRSQLINHNSQLIIVTNLPYIPSKRIPSLDYSVKDFEPIAALDGGIDGFELYRNLFQQIKEKEMKFKLFVGEIDDTQKDIALKEAKQYFPQYEVEVKKDLSNKYRILLIRS